MKRTIPPVLFQTYSRPHQNSIQQLIDKNLNSDWEYKFYNDIDVLTFFENNVIPEYSKIIDRYDNMTNWAHKADLFRYYYLYLKGGVFMDMDAMMYVDMDTIIKNYEFVSVKSTAHPGCIFNGVIGGTPRNKIIKDALDHAYNVDNESLRKDYHLLCRHLFKILKTNTYGYNVKLYKENVKKTNFGVVDIIDDTLTHGNLNGVLFKHFWKTKQIPT